ncbi:MAG: response regulator transcription factor [Paracoccaceae bacterium]|nr:response regulator transcription factor [Paracoccaceae bacterium]MDE2760860.1 response regulator transcription factor [Paracoccaceae bacterium]MDE2917892.1 response regulator transcription factor [Paracoccaceae bacterium]MYE37113.1 response regulator transcription factor [Paracoccaceae bacterium]
MASQPKILVIGSNRLVRDTFQDLLMAGGEFEVEILDHISDIQSTLMNTISTVIVFVEDPDDLDVLANDNQNFPPTILILSDEQKAQLSNKELDEFGFVCFIRPFSYQEVLIQLQGIVTRYEIKQQVTFKLDEIVIDPSSLTLTNESGEAVRMTQKEFELLYILYKARGKTLSREYLLREVWGYKKDIITNTLDTHIHWLRQKIEADSANPQIIVTVDGGYQITPEFSSQIL